MQHLKRAMIVLVGLAAIGLLMSITYRPASAGGSAPVTVMNTPLPVSLQGTGSVSGAVTATVNNTTANPVPTARVDNDARNVVRLANSDTIPPGLTDSCGGCPGVPMLDMTTRLPYTVPSGKRLVIDSVSAYATPPAGQNAFATLYNGFTFTRVPLYAQGSFVVGLVQLNTMRIRDYVDSNSQYLVSFTRTGATSGMFWRMDAVGHLEDCTGGC